MKDYNLIVNEKEIILDMKGGKHGGEKRLIFSIPDSKSSVPDILRYIATRIEIFNKEADKRA